MDSEWEARLGLTALPPGGSQAPGGLSPLRDQLNALRTDPTPLGGEGLSGGALAPFSDSAPTVPTTPSAPTPSSPALSPALAQAYQVLDRLFDKISQQNQEARPTFELAAFLRRPTVDAPVTWRALGRLAYGAPFLIEILSRDLALWEALDDLHRLAPPNPGQCPFLPPDWLRVDEEAFMAALRRWKYAVYLRLTAQSLLGLATTPQTNQHLTWVSERMIALAYDWAFHTLALRHGLPARADGTLAAGCVMGMGKLGGGELNYSSDVDVIFLCDADDQPLRRLEAPPTGEGGAPLALWPAMTPEAWARAWEKAAGQSITQNAPEGSLGHMEFYDRLAKKVTQLLSTHTQEGFGLRVDVDLRPLGKSGLLCPSLGIIQNYYDTHGREWERVALIKARCVAGSPAVARQFQAITQPFVYRRYLDFAAIEGVALVKHDIDRHHHGVMASNIKLGKGGIRENEFVTQALQLLHGGKREALRVPGHQAACQALAATGTLPLEEVEAHLKDYWALRALENRLQMVREAQTQELPGDSQERTRVLHDFAPGFAAREARAWQAVEAARAGNLGRFNQLFANLGPDLPPVETHWREVLEAHAPPEFKSQALARADALLEDLMRTRAGERCVFKAERLLSRVELYSQGTQWAFWGWIAFLERLGNRNAIYALLEANPAVVAWVGGIFREGERLAQPLIRHPEYLETFVSAGPLTAEGLRAEFRGLTLEALSHGRVDEEEFLVEVQNAKAQATVRILSVYLAHQPGDLAGALQPAPEGHRALLSALADAVVEACLIYAWHRLAERHGLPEGAGAATGAPLAPHPDPHIAPHPATTLQSITAAVQTGGFAVVALGKHGSQDMNFFSDLDVLYVCAAPEGLTQGVGGPGVAGVAGVPGGEGGEGGKQGVISREEFYTKLAKRLNVLLTSPTQFGVLYDMDHRLRPFGGKGVMVPSLDAYQVFLSTSAEVWNFQALTRLRHIAGDGRVSRDLTDIVARTWRAWAAKDPPTNMMAPPMITAQIHHMLGRLVAENQPKNQPGRLQLKYAVGGMLGFEFLRQNHFLRQAAQSGLWQAPPDSPELARLLPLYQWLATLDERLACHVERHDHTLGPDQWALATGGINPGVAPDWQGLLEAVAALEAAVESGFAPPPAPDDPAP